MSKERRKSSRRRAHGGKASPETLRRQGMQAFERGDEALSIAAWRRIRRAQRDPQLTAAFAEACFRRGLKESHLDSLRQAVNLQGELCYVYHLALAYHRANQMDEAEPLYRRLLSTENWPALCQEKGGLAARAAYAFGLLLLEIGRRPSQDALWQHLADAPDDSALGLTRRRLAWAEQLSLGRAAPSGPAPDVYWELLAARRSGQADPQSIHIDDTPDTFTGVVHYHQGVRAWEQDDLEGAFAHWQAAQQAGLEFYALSHNLFAVTRRLAMQRLQAKDYAGALQAAQIGRAAEPNDKAINTIVAQARSALGNADAKAGRWKDALEHWRQAVMVSGERSRRLVINMALALEQQEAWVEAAELWREALRRRPRKADHPDALNDAQVARLWQHVAESYRRIDDMYEAQRTYKNALKWSPDDVQLRTAYVDMLLDGGRLTAADNQLDILLKAHPQDIDLLERRAQIYASQYYPASALEIWEQILELQPDHQNARRQIARIYERMGDYQHRWGWFSQAIHYYELGLSFAPQDGALLASVGMCHLDQGDEELAQQFFERAFNAEPTNAEIYLMVIRSWLNYGDWPAVKAVIERALEAIEPGVSFWLDIADSCYRYNSPHHAKDFVNQALLVAHNDANLMLAIADLVGRNRDFDLALDIIQDALKLNPDNPLAYVLQGMALVNKGNVKAAQRSWYQAEEIARQTRNEMALAAVQEIRFLYDPEYRSSTSYLDHLFGLDFDDEELDDEWDDE